MKLKNKLVLSCVALAACATTMVSTTFAWYTSNTEVSATGAQGHTATTGTDTLLISPTGQAKSWTNTIKINISNPELRPLSFGTDGNGAGGKFHEIQAAGTINTEEAVGGIIEFSVYLKNTEAETSNIYLKNLTITNEKASGLPEKNVLTAEGLPNVTGPTYTVDILRSTNVLIYSDVQTTGDLDGEDTIFKNPVQKLLLDTTSYASPDSVNGKENIDAHKYYKAITGHDAPFNNSNPLTGQNYVNVNGTVLNLGQITKTQMMKVTVKLFVNGADLECFDAIQGQTLTLGINFSTSDSDAIKFQTSAPKAS